MAEFTVLQVFLWGMRVGVAAWDDDRRTAEFQYDPEFVRTGLEVSPIRMPLGSTVYRFPEHRSLPTFLGLCMEGGLPSACTCRPTL